MSTEKEGNMSESNHGFSPRAPLAALGLKLKQLDFFKPMVRAYPIFTPNQRVI
jgi:hypothetical protein